MICPICHKRKAKRFCPARAENICSQCCGTEREVTIDCHSDCPHLIASRQYDFERKEIDWSKAPFPESRIRSSFVNEHAALVEALAYRISLYAGENRPLVDSDALQAIQSLAQSYRTLSSGIYYENPPDYHYQRGLYEALKSGIEEFKEHERRRLGVANVRDSDVRDSLIFLAQLCFVHHNGRPKSRAFLDLLRSQFKPKTPAPSPANLVVIP